MGVASRGALRSSFFAYMSLAPLSTLYVVAVWPLHTLF
jgi:hypothetical protein